MTKNKTYRLLNGALGLLFCIFLYGHIARHIPYQLCELEHENLFISDAATWQTLGSTPGGMAEGACQWLMQFLALPQVGIGMFLLPLALLWPVALGLLRRRGISSLLCYTGAFGLTLLQLFTQYDFNFYLSGTLALLGALTMLYVASLMRSPMGQTIAFVAGIPCVAWLLGSVVTWYVVGGIVLFFKADRWISTAAAPLLVFALTLGIGYGSGSIDSLTGFLSPAFYYRPLMEMPTIPWVAWGFPIVLFGVGRLFPTMGDTWKPTLRLAATVCLWGVLLGGFLRYEAKYRNTSNQILWQLNHYAFQEDWQGMLDFLATQPPLTNLLYMNYANMALAQTDRLGDYAFHFHPRSVKALLVEPNRTSSVHMLLSDVHYTVGCIAEAQRHAFEAQVASPRMCGIQTMMRMVKTNLILGHDAVAEKYLGLIEKTRFHHAWAQRYRRFLYNPQALEADAELGEKRRGLSRHNRFFMSSGWNGELEDILEADPSNRKAVTYLGMSYLLAKDLQGFRRFLEQYYGTESLKKLPIAFQQGVVAAYAKEVDRWADFQLSPQVKEQYAQYLQQLKEVQRLPGRKKRMEASFGHTFWFYFMFTKN